MLFRSQSLIPGVEDTGEAELGAAGLGGGDVLEGGGALLEEERIEDLGMKQASWP